MSIGIVQKRVTAWLVWLWSDAAVQGGFLQRLLIASLRILMAVLRDLKDGQLSLRAMSLVYTTVIAIVPLIALSFSVLKGFGMHNRVEPALLDALVDIGDKRFDIVANVMRFIDNVNVGVLGSVGFAILIYSVISMMQKIEHAFNYTWQIKRGRNISHRFRDYLSVIFVGPLLIFLSAAITTSANTSAAIEYFTQFAAGAQIIAIVGNIIPYLMMSAGFAFIYVFLPNTAVNMRSAFIGGLVTAIIWKIMGWGVSTFIANSAANVAIYSAFASVIILMVWMYLGWLVLLIGASVAFYHQNPQYLKVRRDKLVLSTENNEKLAVNILYLVGQHYLNKKSPWTVSRLAKKFAVPPHIVDEAVDKLIRTSYLVRSLDNQEQLFPRQPVETVDIEELIDAVRSQQLQGAKQDHIQFDSGIDRLFSEIKRRSFENAEYRYLKDLAD